MAKPAAAEILLTILNGQAVLHIGTDTVAAAQGLRLPEGTLVETLAATGLLRLEWPDGTLLDLGPDTAVMLEPAALIRNAVVPHFYLLRGWAKQRGAPGTPHRGHVSPRLDVLPGDGAVVANVSSEMSWLFIEAGNARLQERAGANALLALGLGQTYLRKGASKGELSPRPNSEILQQVPRSFRDMIAPRAALFVGKQVSANALEAPYYAELRPWLIGEPALRRDFPRRFAPLLRDPGFRAALAARLADHPEWAALVHPKPPARRASAPYGAKP